MNEFSFVNKKQLTMTYKIHRGCTIILLFVIAFTFITLAGCAGDDGNDNNAMHSDITQAMPLPGDGQPVIEGISNDKIFDSIIWGWYTAVEDYTDLSDFADGMIYEDYPLGSEPDNRKSVLPYWIQAGPHESTNSTLYGDYPEYNWMVMYFQNTAPAAGHVTVPYKTEGNRLIIALEYDIDQTTKELSNIMWGHAMNFRFDGRNLVLSRSGAEVTMMPYDFRQDSNREVTTGYLSSVDNAFGRIVSVSYRDNDSGSGLQVRQIDLADGWRAIDPDINFSGDGTMSMSWTQEAANRSGIRDNKTSLTCRYIWGGSSGFILIDDDGELYPYQMSEKQWRIARLALSLGDIDVSGLSDQEIDRLSDLQQNVMDDIQTALDDADIEADINRETGQITMDNSILFDVGDYTLSDEGKAYLDEFLDAYAAVILSDAYSSDIAEIIVEGHTDSKGSYESNMTLSENRANAVYEYCVTRQPELAGIMVTKGMSYDQLVYDSNGNEDQAASRRVVFRFILNTN